MMCFTEKVLLWYFVFYKSVFKGTQMGVHWLFLFTFVLGKM